MRKSKPSLGQSGKESRCGRARVIRKRSRHQHRDILDMQIEMARAPASTVFDPGRQAITQDVSCLTRPQAPRQGKSSRMTGIQRVDKGTIFRWQQDGQRYAPYRYQAEHVLWNPEGNSRMPNVGEMEALKGFFQRRGSRVYGHHATTRTIARQQDAYRGPQTDARRRAFHEEEADRDRDAKKGTEGRQQVQGKRQ